MNLDLNIWKRGMKSCSIWCEDPVLNEYFKATKAKPK